MGVDFAAARQLLHLLDRVHPGPGEVHDLPGLPPLAGEATLEALGPRILELHPCPPGEGIAEGHRPVGAGRLGRAALEVAVALRVRGPGPPLGVDGRVARPRVPLPQQADGAGEDLGRRCGADRAQQHDGGHVQRGGDRQPLGHADRRPASILEVGQGAPRDGHPEVGARGRQVLRGHPAGLPALADLPRDGPGDPRRPRRLCAHPTILA